MFFGVIAVKSPNFQKQKKLYAGSSGNISFLNSSIKKLKKRIKSGWCNIEYSDIMPNF